MKRAHLWLPLLAFLACSAPAARARPVPGPADAATDLPDPDPRESVIGTGRGPTIEAAEAAARAEIAKFFSVSVEQRTTATDTSRVSTEKGRTSATESADLLQRTTVRTQRVLAGSEIVRRRQEGTGWVAVAVLHRARAIESARARAQESAERMQRLAAGQGKSPLDEARRRYQVLEAAQQVEVSNQDLQVLGADPVAAPVRAADAELALREWVRSRVPVSITVEAPPAARTELEPLLESGLSALGLSLARGDAAVLRLAARCTVTPVDRGQPEVRFVRLTVYLDATDASGARIAQAGPLEAEGSGLDDTRAIQRALYLVRTRHLGVFLGSIVDRILH